MRFGLVPFIDDVGLLTWASTRRGGTGIVSLRPWLAKRGVPEADINALVDASGTMEVAARRALAEEAGDAH